jgi:hypothetical protein
VCNIHINKLMKYILKGNKKEEVNKVKIIEININSKKY